VVDADPEEGRTYPAESARAVATRAENVKVLTNMFEMLIIQMNAIQYLTPSFIAQKRSYPSDDIPHIRLILPLN
jgi:hypothetical protein